MDMSRSQTRIMVRYMAILNHADSLDGVNSLLPRLKGIDRVDKEEAPYGTLSYFPLFRLGWKSIIAINLRKRCVG